MKTLEQLCNTTPKVTATFRYGAAKSRPDWGDGEPAHNWRVTVRYRKRQLTTDYFGGILITNPEACEVLGSLLMDSDAEYEASFEDWAESLGYDPDSRRAENIYKECKINATKTRQLLGSDFDTFREAEY